MDEIMLIFAGKLSEKRRFLRKCAERRYSVRSSADNRLVSKSMFKLLILAGLLATSLSLYAQSSSANNTLLSPRFWAGKPPLTLVEEAVSQGHNPAAYNARMMDPVTLAINADAPLEVIAYLIAQEGNTLSKQTHHFRTYLHWAAARGNTALVEYLISQGADVAALDEHGNSPLFYAVGNGLRNRELTEVFRKAGYPLTTRNKAGATLMMLSIASDHNLEYASYLSEYGLRLSDQDSVGATLVDYAAREAHIPHLRALMGRGLEATKNALRMAAQGTRRKANDLSVFQYLIEEVGLNPHVKTQDGATLLHLVASKPNAADIAPYLMACGVSPKATDANGNNALMVAAGGRSIPLIEQLLPHTDIAATNDRGESALTFAVKSGSAKVLRLLLSRGADHTIRDTRGYNLGYYWAQHYRSSMPTFAASGQEVVDEFALKLATLQEIGLNLAQPQHDGTTLYHYAASRGNLALINAVAHLGIDPNQMNDEGLTALHKAALTSHDTTILKRLIELGADKRKLTDLGETAYELALENDYLKRAGADISFLK